MSNFQYNANELLLSGIKSRNYELIYQAMQLGGAKYDKTKHANTLLFKSWNEIILLNDISIIEHIYNAYNFKSSHHFQNLLVSIILNNKPSFDFFLDHCVRNRVDLNHKHGILLSNACSASPFITYEEDFKKHYTSDHFISKLLEHNIDLNCTSKHPLVLLANKNNFHSWKILFNHIKNKSDYQYENFKTPIIHSLYEFLDRNNFLSDEVQYFFNNFNKKIMFSYGLKKISHPSYKGNDLATFCMEMFSQEPDLFLSRSKQLGKNNENFSEQINKINLYNKLNHKLPEKNKTNNFKI